MLALRFAGLGLAALPALACDMMSYRRVQASEHVVVFEAAEGTTAVVNGNIVAVTGRDATLVVDTGQIPSIARRVIGELRAQGAAPVRYIVNTHWHGDHLMANFVFREAYPDVRILAHPHTIEQAKRYYSDYATRMAERLPKAVAEMRQRLEASKSGDERVYLTRTLECVDRLMPEVRESRLEAPGEAVEHDRAIDLGGVHARVRHLGSGNTPGDLVVWVEEDRLVASGDMVVAPVPYAIGSPLEPWIRTLDALAALGAKVIVPGHGPVMRDHRYLDDVKALIAGSHAQVAAMRAAGVPEAEAAARLDTAKFRASYVDTPMRRQAFEEFYVKPLVAKAYADAKAAKP
jgi:glyoxylase-like metal-dependent hydrolase (beta-lactamase superfamily II)